MFAKILVANRGEIAVRAFRAATELGARTVAVFPHEDRRSEHRLKADESYQIGEEGHPVRAYLDHENIVRVAVECGADAIYPGYGFLSENPAARRGLRGERHHLHRPARHPPCTSPATSRARSRRPARPACPPSTALRPDRPTSTSWPPRPRASASRCSSRPSPAAAGAACAASTTRRRLRESLEAAQREAEAAFGDPTLYLEQAVVNPRHIEVQVLADSTGTVLHLYERDCSVQRRHQKVVEIAPAPNLDPDTARADVRRRRALRRVDRLPQRRHRRVPPRRGRPLRLHRDEPAHPGRAHRHRGGHRRRPRRAPRCGSPSGETFADLGMRQEDIYVRGAALQCRITTEDPANGFRPDAGQITVYRSAGGGGRAARRRHGVRRRRGQPALRLDAGQAHLPRRAPSRWRCAAPDGRWRSSGSAASRPTSRSSRRCSPTRSSSAAQATTSFIDERPELLEARMGGDRGTKLLTYLADVTVNQPHGPATTFIKPRTKLPAIDRDAPLPPGTRDLLLRVGPGRVRPPAARAHRRAGHRHHLPRRPPVACSPPGCAPATCCTSPGTSRG